MAMAGSAAAGLGDISGRLVTSARLLTSSLRCPAPLPLTDIYLALTTRLTNGSLMRREV